MARGPKPLAVTGFGTAAYRGAGDRGGRVLEVVRRGLTYPDMEWEPKAAFTAVAEQYQRCSKSP